MKSACQKASSKEERKDLAGEMLLDKVELQVAAIKVREHELEDIIK